jgi:type IV pilus assembly protein PilX
MKRMKGLRGGHRQQRGVVLYIALIILVLLALIGVVAMRVTNMQERMSANYMRTNQSFQLAEESARSVEAAINAAVTGASGTYAANQEVCSPVFDPQTWAEGVDTATATYTRRIDTCFGSSSSKIGTKLNEQTGNIYEITVLASDDNANATSTAVIDTIFIP